MTTPTFHETTSVEDLEAMLDGIATCQDCPVYTDRPFFKCRSCYAKWYSRIESTIVRYGYVRCTGCRSRFSAVDDLSDYRLC